MRMDMYYLYFNAQHESFDIFSEDQYFRLKERPTNVIVFSRDYLHTIKEILGMNV